MTSPEEQYEQTSIRASIEVAKAHGCNTVTVQHSLFQSTIDMILKEGYKIEPDFSHQAQKEIKLSLIYS